MQKVDIVANRGPVSLAKALPLLWRGAASIDIASAFISANGLNALSPALSAGRSANVRLLVGLYQCFTTPTVLDCLFRLQARSNGRVCVHVSRDRHFHAKMSISRNHRVTKVVIGSSNLTDGGMTGTGEVNAVISLSANSSGANRAMQAFDAEWDNSVLLTRSRITRYRRFFETLRPGKPMPSVPVWVLGQTSDDEEHGAGPRRKHRFWRCSVTGTLNDKTVTLLGEVTDWDKKGYGYFSASNPPFKRGDRIMFFDFVGGLLREVKYMDKVRSPVRTPDGRDFVAYDVLNPQGPKRMLTKKALTFLKKLLRQRGVSGLQNRRLLSAKDACALQAFLRTGKHC